jgi:hypothetical protein
VTPQAALGILCRLGEGLHPQQVFPITSPEGQSGGGSQWADGLA